MQLNDLKKYRILGNSGNLKGGSQVNLPGFLVHIGRFSGRYQVFPLFLGLISGLLFSGCARQPRVMLENPLEIQAAPGQIWEICQKEVKSRGFELDRADKRFGIIETFPLTSKQWFEFWRKDVVGSRALAESSLQTIRRRVKLVLTPVKKGKYIIDCKVMVDRLNRNPEMHDSSALAQNTYIDTLRRRSIEHKSDYTIQESYWTNLGEDKTLEADILRSIAEKLKKGA